jgi:hypothetical protein
MANRKKPSNERAIQMTVSMRPEQFDRLHTAADELGVAVSAVVRGFIDDGLYRHANPKEDEVPILVVQQRALSVTDEERYRMNRGCSGETMGLVDDTKARLEEMQKNPPQPWFESSTLLSEEDKELMREAARKNARF